MKKFARITLLIFWLFAIVAPSIITLCNVEQPVVITNLNEEEQQETSKKVNGEEKFVNNSFLDFSLLNQSRKSNSCYYYCMGHLDHTLENVLPPPKNTH